MVDYPDNATERDRWILARRPVRSTVDPQWANAAFIELERAADGSVVPIAAIFLANRECPWKCLMCDLWKNTLSERVPVGAIVTQIDRALSGLPPAAQIKLYNSGSFFDSQAIPPEDFPEIAARVGRFDNVIVECHPNLVNDRVVAFADLLSGSLEVALGLETAHPGVLEKLNKRMTLDDFARAASFLRSHQIHVRAFILVKPPFLDEAEALHWANRSIDFAFHSGAEVCSLIPTRFGNGALETLAQAGYFSPPQLQTLEQSLAYGINLRRGRVFADLWDLDEFSRCSFCLPARRARLEAMNFSQTVPPPVQCPQCSA